MKNSILSQLSFKPGQLSFKGIRYMLIRPDTITHFQKEVEAAVGEEKCAEIMMAGGLKGGSRSTGHFRESLGYNEKEIVDFMCGMGSELGWGEFRLMSLDMESGRLVVEVTGSPFAAAYGRSDSGVCHMIRGVLKGLGSSVFEGEVSSSETRCISKGDEMCRFEISKHLSV